MDNSGFDFLQELNPELLNLARSIEKIFYEDSHAVLVKGRLFAEKLLEDVVIQEEMMDLLYVKQVERISRLEKAELLPKEIAKSFDTIRYIGNRAAHESSNGELEQALKVHRNLFKISVWYMEVYGNYKFIAPAYKEPQIKKVEGLGVEQVNELISKTIQAQILKLNLGGLVEEPNQEKTNIAVLEQTVEGELKVEERTFQDINQEIHGSSLVYQLSKLKESSQEAIEGCNSLSEFKKYIHVERPIQNNLLNVLEVSSSIKESQLILLCGSVGDGKSHLLSYMSQNYPSLISRFQIHNDATESFDPLKNSLDTLSEVLEPFSDSLIESSNTKLILAINLGVLHNFLESHYAKESYTKISDFIRESKLFDSNYISDNYSKSNFHLISFGDYHPFELTQDGPQSSYFKSLLDKVTDNKRKNPFFQAYLRDVEKDYSGPVRTNFELLMIDEVKEGICQILIKAIIKHKLIISTRAMLNFLYDIIVPPNIEEYVSSATIIEESEGLLPNLLFASDERSILLNTLSKLDPIHIRSLEIDQVLVELNNSSNITEVFHNYLNVKGIEEWIKSLEELGPFYELSSATKQILNSTLIRTGYFLSSQLSKAFAEPTFDQYMNHLYSFNRGMPAGLKTIYQEIKRAIFTWKGSPKSKADFIYLSDDMETMKIAQTLNLKPDLSHLICRDKDIFYRFRSKVNIVFQSPEDYSKVSIEVDYPLYERILKVLEGYRPNKKDKEDAIQFVEFIERLMKLGSKEEELLVHYLAEDLMFRLKFDSDFQEFSFKRD